MKTSVCCYLVAAIAFTLALVALADEEGGGRRSGRQKRQLQTLLANALRQNPSLIGQLQTNPALLANLQSALLRDSRSQLTTPAVSVNAFGVAGSLLSKPQLTEPVDQCSSLRRQNKRLKDLLHTLTADEIDEVPRAQELALDLLPSPAPSPANLLIPQQAKPVAAANLLQQLPSISVHSQLVTPTATWTELLSTTSYQTTITQTETSEVPILWRGKKIVTTIFDTNTQVVQATEIKTSSVLITPAPTWSTTTVTVTPSPIVPVNQPRRKNVLERATVLEIDKQTSPREASQRLNTLKQVYSLFGDRSSTSQVAKRLVNNPHQLVKQNPLFDDVYDDFDQQALAAQQRPVYVPQPPVVVQPSSKVFTLYFSGRTPGEYSTQLTTMRVDANGNPIRQKREAIAPTKVQPILTTQPPSSLADALSFPQESYSPDLNEVIQSSINPTESRSVTHTVTVTETVTVCGSAA